MKLIILTFVLISQVFAQDMVQIPNNGISEPHQKFLKCRNITNSGSSNIMVPLKTRGEFDSFIATPPPGVTAVRCKAVDSFEAMSGNVPDGGWTLHSGTPGCLSLDTVWKTAGTYSLQNTCAGDTTNIRYNVDLTGIDTINLDVNCLGGGRTPACNIIISVVGTGYSCSAAGIMTCILNLGGALSGYYDINIHIYKGPATPKLDNLTLEPMP